MPALLALAVASAGTLVGVGATVSPAVAADPTVTVTPASTTIGGVVRIEGTGWLTTDGAAGSQIAVKINDGAYSRLPGQGPHANLTIWDVIQANPDGSFAHTMVLPNASNSTPAFGPGTYTLRFLTGSLPAPGVSPARTMQSNAFTVTAPVPPTPPTPPTPPVPPKPAPVASKTNFKLKPARVKAGKRARAIVVVKSRKRARGVVQIKRGKKVIARATVKKANGRVVVRLPKLKRGRHPLRATFRGSGTVKASVSKRAVLRVR